MCRQALVGVGNVSKLLLQSADKGGLLKWLCVLLSDEKHIGAGKRQDSEQICESCRFSLSHIRAPSCAVVYLKAFSYLSASFFGLGGGTGVILGLGRLVSYLNK